MAQSDMTPFDALRATFHMAYDDTELMVASPDGLTQLKLSLRHVEPPFEETLAIETFPSQFPSVPVIMQTELNGKVWVKVNVARYVIEADNLAELGFKIGLLSSVNGFTTATLALLRQAGGDSEFAGYFRRV